MVKSEFYKKAYRIFLIIISIIVIFFAIKQISYVALAPIVIIGLCPIFAFLVFKQDSVNPTKKFNLTGILIWIHIICIWAIYGYKNKAKAHFTNIFLSGKVVKEDVYHESDEGIEEGYHKEYFFQLENDNDEQKKEIVEWILVGYTIGTLLVLMIIIKKIDKEKEDYLEAEKKKYYDLVTKS
jgi:hypothetical protein